MWICDQRLYRSDRGKIVQENDVRARILIAAPGDELPNKPVIEKLDTGQPGGTKMIARSEDKAVKPSENKGRKVEDAAKRAESLDLFREPDEEA